MPVVYTYRYGTDLNDLIFGINKPSYLYGYRGNDLLVGGSARDYIYGGVGNDTMMGGGGNNHMVGGNGIDVVRYTGHIDDYEFVFGSSAGSLRVLRSGFTPEGTGTDTILSVEALDFVADNYRLWLNGTNNAVLARNDDATAAATSQTALNLSRLTSNDSEFDGDTIVFNAVDGHSALGASISVVNGFAIYNPGQLFAGLAAGATATDSFTYTVSDGKGGFDTATVTLHITGDGTTFV